MRIAARLSLTLVLGAAVVAALQGRPQEPAAGARADRAAQAPLPPPAPGYQRVLPWGPVPEDPAPVSNYVVWNRNVFWEMGRVAVNTKGDRLYAFRRSDPPILQIDPATGKILKEFGTGMFVWPHGMYVDKDNNLWATDTTVSNADPKDRKSTRLNSSHRL